MTPVSPSAFAQARERVAKHAHRTPMLTSATLNRRSGFDVGLKAEMFQRTGSYKFRGPLNKLLQLTEEERARGIICSSAGNHAQGVALAAAIYGVPAVVVMAENATPSKVEATRAYGAEVVLAGTMWDEANDVARELAAERGLTPVHPFDDLDLIAGQGTVGLEITEDFPELDVVVVPIGGGGLISGVALAVKQESPQTRVVGVESSGAPAMQQSVRAGRVVPLESVDSVIDGLKVKRVGNTTFSIVRDHVDDIVTLPDREMFDAVVWMLHHCKVLVEGAAAAPVAALLAGLVDAPTGARVACVLSGGNVNLDRLRQLTWN
ncbi:MAG TPA: threonine/serine dehydratase [Gaiellaceae bacterium]|nr:threonine/serine dehydratase [Gaiellaceae bacterium]